MVLHTKLQVSFLPAGPWLSLILLGIPATLELQRVLAGFHKMEYQHKNLSASHCHHQSSKGELKVIVS